MFHWQLHPSLIIWINICIMFVLPHVSPQLMTDIIKPYVINYELVNCWIYNKDALYGLQNIEKQSFPQTITTCHPYPVTMVM